MNNNFSSSVLMSPVLGGLQSSGTNTGFALNSDFVLGSAGACVGIRFHAPVGGKHIHAVYVFLHATNATDRDLTCHLANYGTLGTYPGTSIRSVTSPGGTTANKWVKFDFSGYTDVLTINTMYWLVVGDSAGSTGSYQIRTRNLSAYNSPLSVTVGIYTSTNGFTSAGTGINYPMAFIIVFSDGSVVGHPYTQAAPYANNTLERGLKFSNLSSDLKISGLIFVGHTYMTSLQIYEGDTSPNGSVWSGFNNGNNITLTAAQKTIGYVVFDPVILKKNTTYRITFKFSGATVAPNYNEVEDYVIPGDDALSCCYGQGNFCSTINNGAGGWTDTPTQLPKISLILQDTVAGGGLLRASGMGGGING